MHKVQAATARAFQKIREHLNICWLSHYWWETTSHTKLVSYSQWNPQLMTTKQTSVFTHVKYIKYEMEYGTLTFCFMQHRQGGLTWCKTYRWDREIISFWFTFKRCCGFTSCFMNPPFHHPCISGSCSQNYLWSHAFFMRISYSSTCLISFYPLSIK